MDDKTQERLIRDCCQEVKHLEGQAIEVGVHRGASAEFICEMLPEATVYCFDTFQGMPAEMITKGLDYHTERDFRDTSFKLVSDRLKRFGNACIIAGVFPQSAIVEPRIKFAHIDVDLYQSTKQAIEWVWPLLVDGGVLLDDDYGCGSCAGAKKAVDEFAKANGVEFEIRNKRAILRRHL